MGQRWEKRAGSLKSDDLALPVMARVDRTTDHAPTGLAASDQLAEYRKKQDFAHMSEPRGKRTLGETDYVSVVRKHAPTNFVATFGWSSTES